MRKLLPTFVIIIATVLIFRASLGGLDSSVLKDPSKLIYQYPCAAPVSYKIGSIDERFNVTEAKFLADTKTAASIWNKTYGQEVFKHDQQEAHAVSINLVYDDRQSLNSRIKKYENVVGSSLQDLDSKIAEYERRASEFERRLSAFNAEVKKWNEQGGAPEGEYEKLKKEQEYLEAEGNYLNREAQNLNISTSKHNSQVGQLNNTIDNLNEVLKVKPEGGIFDPVQNKIDIYFDIDQNELIHTLAHELGHSRGLGHNENEKAIMFPYSTEVIVLASADIDSLKAFCERKSIWGIFMGRVSLFYNFVRARYEFSK